MAEAAPAGGKQGTAPAVGLRVAVIGLGAAGGFSIAGVRAIPSATVVAGADVLGEAAPAAAIVDGPVYRDVRGLRDSTPFDVAVVATPTPTHADVVAALVADGPNRPGAVWVEKPLAVTHAEIDACAGAAAVAGVELRTLLHTAFAPEVMWAHGRHRTLVERHGPIVETHSRFLDPYRDRLTSYTAVLGGSWIDSGVNALSVLARFVALADVRAVDGAAPLACEAEIAFDGPEGAGTARIDTEWVEVSSDKATAIRFSDGTQLELSHSAGSARVVAGGAVVEARTFGKAPLERRYREMLPSYAARTAEMLPAEVEARIHDCAATVAERNGGISR
jgi:predicted dehydrogenase